jgi:hypothetical protein
MRGDTAQEAKAMRGRERTRKKHLKRVGWRIVSEERAEESGYRLTLDRPDGQRVTAEAPTRPRAYQRAQLLARQQTTAL